MNNYTSKHLSSAKIKSAKYHAEHEDKLYHEYLNSGDQYKKSFLDWKNEKFKKSPKHGKMQKPLTPEQRKERGYNTRSLNQNCRWK